MSMKRFVPKKRSKKKAESEASPEDTQMKELEKVFDLGQTTAAEPVPETPAPVDAAEDVDLLGDLRQGVFAGREGSAPLPKPLDLGLGEPPVEEGAEETQASEIRAQAINRAPQASRLGPVKEPALPQMGAIDLGLPTEEAVEEPALPQMGALDLGLPMEEAVEETALPQMEALDLGLPAEQAAQEPALTEMQALDLGLPMEEAAQEPALPEMQALDLGLPMEEAAQEPALPEMQALDLGLPMEEAAQEPALPEMQALDLGLPMEEAAQEPALPEMQALDLGLPMEEAVGDLALPEMQPIDLGLPMEEAVGDLALPEMQPIDLGLGDFPALEEPAAPGVMAQAVNLAPEPVPLDAGAVPATPPIEGRPMTLTPGAPVGGDVSAGAAPVATPGQRPGSGEVLDALPGNLKDIFRKKVVANPQLKALLKRHDRVDVHELADELQEFARSVGATEERE